jgi:tRNA(Ile)-lysidine synthase
MLSKLQENLIRECKLIQDEPILVGISGGPDSLVLLDALHQLGYQVIIAHLNHKLRPESTAEALYVEEIAGLMNIPFVQSEADVLGYANEHGFSVEEAARSIRYDFLFDIALSNHVQAVAVGHTADDQVETVLMHLLRGAGLAGLRGMAYRTLPNPWSDRIPLIRPMLSFWREEILHYCSDRDLIPMIDKSNLDQTYFRNRLRYDLIPSLESYNPKIKDLICQTAFIMSEDYKIISSIIEKTWEECLFIQGPGYLALDIDRLQEQPLGVRRHIIRKAIAYHCPDLRDIDFKTIENVISFLANPTRTFQRDLVSGLMVTIEQNILWLAKWETNLPELNWPTVPKDAVLVFNPPCTNSLGNGWELNAGILSATDALREQVTSNHDPYQAWLDISGLASTLHIRSRLAGDRFQPLGMQGRSVKLSDLMINLKIPRRARERWPLICSEDTIIWVPGYRSHHAFRLTDKTEKVLYLQLKTRLKPLMPEKENRE